MSKTGPQAQDNKGETFNFRIDPTLKTAFTAATEEAGKPAAQVLREFMRVYVKRRAQRAFEEEARRQSLAIAARAAEPASDDYAVIREIDADLELGDFADAWTA